MASTDSIPIVARCHCSLFNKTISIPSSAFPLESALCHCNSCRRSAGHLFATFAVIPLPVPDKDFFKDLVSYKSSPNLSRYFCPQCGASVCNVENSEWEFCTGILEAEGGLDGKLDRALLFIGDSGDGGATSWINDCKTQGLKCRKMGGRESQEVTDGMLAAFEKLAENKYGGGAKELEGKCHCQEVKFHILKPDGRGERYGAGLCACKSCSKTSGFEITSWAFVPRAKVTAADGCSLESVLERLGKYNSSPGVDRYFCKRCGAVIMYDKTSPSRDTIDVGVGLLNALEGARVQGWLHWNKDGDNVFSAEDALDQDFVSKLAEGIRKRTTPDK